MKKLLEDILLTGLGAAVITKEKAEELVKEMVEQGDVSRKEGKELLEKFLEKTEAETSKLSGKISEHLEKKLKQAGFVTNNEVEELKLRIAELEKELNNLQNEEDESTEENDNFQEQ